MTRTNRLPGSSSTSGSEGHWKVVDRALWVCVLLIPFIGWGQVPWLTGPFALMMAGVLLFVMRAGCAEGRIRIPAAPIWVPLVMVLGLSLIHMVRSPVPYSSLLFLVQVSVAMIFYYLLWFRRAAAASVNIILFWICVLVPWIAVQVLLMRSRAPIGPFLNPNYTATVVLVCLGAVLGRLIRSREEIRKTVVMLAAAVMCSIGLLLIGSRSAGLGMILLWSFYILFGKGRLRWVSLFVIAMILLLPSTARYRVTEEYKADPHAFSRIRIWNASLRMGADHPLIGVGPNLFYEYGPAYAFPMEELPVRYGRIAKKPHNEYLKSWAEGGIIGVTTLGLFLVIVMRMALLAVREGRTAQVLPVGVLFYQAFFHDITEVFSLMIMMSWCLAQITSEEYRRVEVQKGFRCFLPAAVSIVVLSFSIWLTLDLASRYFWLKGQRLIESDIHSARESVLTATNMNPLLPGAMRDLGRILLIQGGNPKGEPQTDRTMAVIKRAQSLNRLDTVPLRLEAALFIREARTGEVAASKGLTMAAAKLKEASLIEPYNALIRLSQAELYWDLNQHRRALDLVGDALELEPNYLQAHRKRVSWLSILDPDRAGWAETELLRAEERASGYRANSEYEEIILR